MERATSFFHAVELGGVGGAVVIAHDHAADLLGGDVGGHVHGDALLFHAGEIFGEGGPILADAIHVFDGQAVARRYRGAFADDIERDAVAYLAFGVAVAEQGEVGVGVEVDEARGGHQPGGVDDAGSGGVPERPMAAMRPPLMAISPLNQGLPVPSTMRAPRMSTS